MIKLNTVPNEQERRTQAYRRSYVKAKHEARKELEMYGYQFDYLRPVSNTFNFNDWKESRTNIFEHLTLYVRKISKGKWGRVIQVADGSFYYLTTCV